MRAFLRVILLTGALAGSTAMGQDAGDRVALPPPVLAGEVSLEEALGRRRSVRDFAPASLPLADLAQMLWAAQGVTDSDGYRTAPSAGALYPLELYVAAGDVDGLAPGVWRYRPASHELVAGRAGDPRAALAAAALHQDWIGDASAVIVVAGVVPRTARKYGRRARRYVHVEVGHAAQNVALQCAARDLGTTMVGAFDDEAVRDVLGLPADHEPFALLPVGRPR
jgi:SagB-type dehydrogenase family enzyme